jgi:oligogalacturonide transport system permease protein
MGSIRRRGYLGFLYIAPWIIGLTAFQVYPFVASLAYSLTEYSILSRARFIGFRNYVDMVTKDPLFFQSLKVTFVYVVLAVPLKLVFALMIAMLLNMKLGYINLYRTLLYLPSILGGSVAVSILWRAAFMNEGIVNSFLAVVGITGPKWLGDPHVAIFTISLLQVWQFGSSMVVFLAGLKQIPRELYESARVDGAGRVAEFLHITIPLLTPMIFFNLIMQTINAFQHFTEAMVITRGGPLNSTFVYAMKLYQEAFQYFKMGYASALSWVLFVIIMTCTFLVFRTSSAWVYYEDTGRK